MSQDFEADGSEYIAGIEAMLAANERLLGSIEEVQAAINALDGKNIGIDLNVAAVAEQAEAIKGYLDSIPDHKNVVITVEQTGAAGGATGDSAEAINDLTDALNRDAEAWSRVENVGRDFSVMMGETIADANEASGALDRVFTVASDGVASVDSATEAVQRFNDGLEQMAAAWSRVEDVGRDFSVTMAEVAAATEAASGAEERLFAVSSGGVATQLSLAEATKELVDALHEEAMAEVELHAGSAYTVADMAVLGDVLAKTAVDGEGVTRMVADLGNTAEVTAGAIASGFLRSVKGIQVFGIGLTGLHWIMMGTFEFLATALPALTALGAGMAAGAEGAQWLADKMQGVYTATEATSQMLGVTAGQALGLKGSLQQAQTAADPGVYEILGGALNGLSQPLANGKTLFQGFAQEGVQVIHMIDMFVAKIDVELRGSLGTQLSSLLGNGVKDLQEWGQVLGNLIHVITNFSTAAPGLAQVLLAILDAVSKFLVVVTNHQGLLTFALALEEIYRWGGLVSSIFSILVSAASGAVAALAKMAGSLAVMGDVTKFTGIREALSGVDAAAAEASVGLEKVAGVLAGPWGIAIAAAAVGLGFLIYKLATVQTPAEQFASSMEKAVNSATPTQGFQDILADLPVLQQKFTAAAAASSTAATHFQSAGAASRFLGPTLTATAQDADTYSQANTQLVTTLVNLMSTNVKVGNTYAGLTETMALADAAGVKVGQMFNKNGTLSAVAAQAIQNLIRGYTEMDQTGTTLANDMNVINEQALMQQTDVSKLNQAWDGFISQMTGVSSSVAGLYTDIQTLGNVTLTAHSKITAFSQGFKGMSLTAQQTADALKSFSASSAQTWANFDSAVNQGETAMNSLRTAAAAGGVTNDQYTESIKGIVAQLLPYAQYSSTATSELSALAQQAGGPATSSFGTLSQWVGNTSQATNTLNRTVQTATQYMANLGQVAANLATTMNTAVDQAITAGSVNVQGITAATQKFETALHSAGGQMTSAMIPALQGMIIQLNDAHVPVQDQISILDQLARQAGLSKQAIDQLNAEIQKLQSKTITVTVVTQNIESGATPVKGINPSGGGVRPAASGWLVPGYGGGDIHPALLEGGEAVVPKHLTAAVAPILKAGGVPGFQAGGIVPPSWLTPAQLALFDAFTGSGSSGSGGSAGSGAPVSSPLPGSSQFLGDWLPSSLTGLGGTHAAAPSGGGGTATLETTQPINVHVTLDGRQIWQGTQKETLKFNLRNNGVATGLMKPK